MNYTLVDSPVTIFSSIPEIEGWLAEVRANAAAAPNDQGWQSELQDAEDLMTDARKAVTSPGA